MSDNGTQRVAALSRVRAAVFDMDGLLLDSERIAARAWSEAARRLGVAFDADLALTLIGRNADDSRRILRARLPRDYPLDALFAACRVAWDEIAAREGVPVKPGVHALLDWIELRRWPRAVATSTRRERAHAALARAALIARFDAVVGGDEVVRGKPEPDIYREAARRLGVAADECVAFEDSEPGVRAAVAAGMQVFMVPDLAPAPSTVAALPIAIVASLDAARLRLEALHGYNPPP